MSASAMAWPRSAPRLRWRRTGRWHRADAQQRWQSHGPAWWLGKGTLKNAFNREAFKDREFRQGAYPFEDLKRVDSADHLHRP